MYKKICVVAAGRLNKSDNTNNGLLLRSLFNSWPKDKIVQIYNSGSNGDEGFFSSYYKLGPNDRRFGSVYHKLYAESNFEHFEQIGKSDISFKQKLRSLIVRILKLLFIDTGLYELLFKVRMSSELRAWVESFEPDVILMQGYSITFSELPLLIKEYSKAKLAFFTTDDWPYYLYSGNLGENKLLSYLPRLKVKHLVSKIMSQVDIPIAFGFPMQQEYINRYKLQFSSIIHSDSSFRFENAKPIRIADKKSFLLVTIGAFTKFRIPLLQDLDKACSILNNNGIPATVKVISNSISSDGIKIIDKMKYTSVQSDPGSEALPSYLKGADLLILLESFDELYAKSISLSISTKAHLYMFSKVPILVYSHPITGIIKYAKTFEWCFIIAKRDITELVNGISILYSDSNLRTQLINNALKIAISNHDINSNEQNFHNLLNN